jgi:sterol desaturase/sphingolipid hydroxylase (fatty acid hydroxylase superfamily)
MGMLPDYVDLLAALGLSALLIGAGRAIERRRPVEPDHPAAAMHSDIKCALINIIANWLFGPVAGALAIVVINRMGGGGLVHLRSDGGWFVVSLAGYLVAKDILEYLYHRAQHRVPVLWAMHALHHSEEAFNVSTGWRHFWLESPLRTAFVYPILGIVFATPPELLLTATVIFMLNHTWAHLNIRLSLGRWALWVMNPQYHRLHHSVEPAHWNRNFADLFPVIDVIFGTAQAPRQLEYPATGLVPGDQPTGIADVILWPLRRPMSLQGQTPARGDLAEETTPRA